jgi:hypothetical protein
MSTTGQLEHSQRVHMFELRFMLWLCGCKYLKEIGVYVSGMLFNRGLLF